MRLPRKRLTEPATRRHAKTCFSDRASIWLARRSDPLSAESRPLGARSHPRVRAPSDVRHVPATDDEQASDFAPALCMLAARSESSHAERQLPPDEPTAILTFWRLFGDHEH